jgi:hypothetical protein
MDPDDPSSAPRFDPALLQSIQNKGKSPMDLAAEQGAKATTGSLVGMLGGE